MFFDLLKNLYFRQTKGFPCDFKLLVSNRHERRHFDVREAVYLGLFFDNCKTLTDGCVYDVGAHVGVFSLIAALSGNGITKVYAFEPTPWNHRTLKLNVAKNHLEHKVVPFELALGDFNGQACIRGIPESGWGGSSIHRGPKPGEKKINVQVAKGDDLIATRRLKRPAIIKIDVEGFEFEVLRGFERTLQNDRPALFLELHPEYLRQTGKTEADVHDFLAGMGYQRRFRKKWTHGEQYQTIYEPCR